MIVVRVGRAQKSLGYGPTLAMFVPAHSARIV